jgi:hypothetical protein
VPSLRRRRGEVLDVDLVDDAGVRRDDGEVLERALAPAQEGVALLVALELALGVALGGVAGAEESTWTEWSMTSSAGTSGLILAGSPPTSSTIASRIAARSTTAGTPVKSCMSTRAGVNAISFDGSAFASQVASASMSAASTDPLPSGAQEVLEQDLQRERQAGDVEARLQRVEAEDLVGLIAHPEVRAGVEGVGMGHATEAIPP